MSATWKEQLSGRIENARIPFRAEVLITAKENRNRSSANFLTPQNTQTVLYPTPPVAPYISASPSINKSNVEKPTYQANDIPQSALTAVNAIVEHSVVSQQPASVAAPAVSSVEQDKIVHLDNEHGQPPHLDDALNLVYRIHDESEKRVA